MNQYLEIKNKIREEMNSFPYGFAITNEQFEEMMRNWGLDPSDTDKIIQVENITFIRKSDKQALLDMYRKHDKLIEDAISQDKTGEGFIFQAIRYEMQNHEYAYAFDHEEAADTILRCIGLRYSDLEKNPIVSRAFKRAERDYFKACDDNGWW